MFEYNLFNKGGVLVETIEVIDIEVLSNTPTHMILYEQIANSDWLIFILKLIAYSYNI